MKVIITSPSLNVSHNVSGISSVTRFITLSNKNVEYIHFEVGKRDNESRNFTWILKILITYFKWVLVLSKNRGALIHFNFAMDKFGLLRDAPMIFIAKILNRQSVLHLHGGEYLLHKTPTKWMKIILKAIFSCQFPVIVLSTKEAEVLSLRFSFKKLFVLPNCVDLMEAKKYNRLFKKNEIPCLLFMGRISLNKGIDYIFNAFKLLKEEGLNFKFFLAGKGPEAHIYVPKFQELLGDHFSYEGVVSGKSKTRLLKDCNTFILPSFFEGLPMALLESMSFGLVPVTTQVGSISDLVNHGRNGIIIKMKSTEEIVNAVKSLAINSIYMQDLSRNARESIFKDYKPEKYLEVLNKIYCYE